MVKQRYNTLHIAFVTVFLLAGAELCRGQFPDGCTWVLLMLILAAMIILFADWRKG